jgi:hypothetical protein
MRARKMCNREEAFSGQRRGCLGFLRAPQPNFPPLLPCPQGKRLMERGQGELSNLREDDRVDSRLRKATVNRWRPSSLTEKRIEYNAQQARIAE